MKKTIWKYEIAEEQYVTFPMPAGAQILSLQVQRGTPMLWALVDPKAPKTQRTFRIIGTGWDFDPSGLQYIGTYQVSGGDFVYHLFERTP